MIKTVLFTLVFLSMADIAMTGGQWTDTVREFVSTVWSGFARR